MARGVSSTIFPWSKALPMPRIPIHVPLQFKSPNQMSPYPHAQHPGKASPLSASGPLQPRLARLLGFGPPCLRSPLSSLDARRLFARIPAPEASSLPQKLLVFAPASAILSAL
jgi:hypothetical protein